MSARTARELRLKTMRAQFDDVSESLKDADLAQISFKRIREMVTNLMDISERLLEMAEIASGASPRGSVATTRMPSIAGSMFGNSDTDLSPHLDHSQADTIPMVSPRLEEPPHHNGEASTATIVPSQLFTSADRLGSVSGEAFNVGDASASRRQHRGSQNREDDELIPARRQSHSTTSVGSDRPADSVSQPLPSNLLDGGAGDSAASTPRRPSNNASDSDSESLSSTQREMSATQRASHRRKKRQRLFVDAAFSLVKKMGQGASGSVFAARLKDGSMAAIKEVKFNKSDQEDILAVRTEVSKLVKMSHPNVIEYYGMNVVNSTIVQSTQVFNPPELEETASSSATSTGHLASPSDTRKRRDSNSKLYERHQDLGEDEVVIQIFMDFGGNTTLRELSTQVEYDGTSLKEEIVAGYIKQLVEALAYVHAQGIVHRDVKGDNVMVGNVGGCTLVDFGAARWSKKEDGVIIVGTPPFMAPEMLNSSMSFSPHQSLNSPSGTQILAGQSGSFDPDSYGSAVDIWSLGITVLELMNGGDAPWPKMHTPVQLFMHIVDPKNAPIIPDIASKNCRDFVSKCCERDPKKRWTAAKLLEHPWLDNREVVPLERVPSTGDLSPFVIQNTLERANSSTTQ